VSSEARSFVAIRMMGRRLHDCEPLGEDLARVALAAASGMPDLDQWHNDEHGAGFSNYTAASLKEAS
jgi:hypothetical protein